VSALARERAHALEEKGKVIDRLQKANRELETSQLASSDELAAGRIEVAKARDEASRLSQEAQAAARRAAEAEAKAKTAETELEHSKQEVTYSTLRPSLDASIRCYCAHVLAAASIYERMVLQSRWYKFLIKSALGPEARRARQGGERRPP